MPSQTPQTPTINLPEPSPQGDDAAVAKVASLSINDGADLLSPVAPSTNEKYSIVQPGVLLTELQPELLGELNKPARALMCGGHADVYKGQWTRPDGETIDVAIKVLRVAIPNSMTTDREKLRRKIDIRMKRETLIWTLAKHPNIHTFLGFKLGDEPQLISPWCPQGNLNDYLSRNGSLSRDRKLKLIKQAGRGLAYLHDQKPSICHADIKPENILINVMLEAVLSDFGVSRVLESLAEHTGLTTTGGGANGTYAYTSPELFNPTLLGEDNYEAKPSCESDVYAFGGVILAVMSGKGPFYLVKHKPTIMMNILGKKTPKPKDHEELAGDDLLWPLMNSCWAFKWSDRPSMNDVLKKIDEIALQ